MSLWKLNPITVEGDVNQDTTKEWLRVWLDDHSKQAYFNTFTHMFAGVKQCHFDANSSDYFPEGTVRS
jgi:hypothetical protein